MDNSLYKPTLSAAKRLGLACATHMGDWFVAWSPRNSNLHGEGSWAHWANLAAMILSDDRTRKVAPHLYRPDLEPNPNLYTDGEPLPEEDLPPNPYEEDDV